MAARLEPVKNSAGQNEGGIYRRHVKSCPRSGRCDCSYVVVWRHRGKQHKATYRTLTDARRAKGRRDAGERHPAGRATFGDYFERWIDSYSGRTSRGFTDTSRALYRLALERHAVPRWSRWRLGDVEPADVRTLYAELREDGASTATLKRLRAALSALFATAVEDRVIQWNPVQGVRIPPAPAGELEEGERAKALTRAELALLLAAIPAEWRLFFELLAHTGLRISEAIGLKWCHLDLGTRPRVMVREQFCEGERRRLKSKHARRDVPLSPGMAERLRQLRRDHYRGDNAPVFTTMSGTELSRPNLASRVLKPAAKAVGLTVDGSEGQVAWVSFHTFRHTCASLLFAEGRNPKQVQEWLGHAESGFTIRTYVHLLDEGVGDADFLDLAVRPAGAARGNTGATPGEARLAAAVHDDPLDSALACGISEQPQRAVTPG